MKNYLSASICKRKLLEKYNILTTFATDIKAIVTINEKEFIVTREDITKVMGENYIILKKYSRQLLINRAIKLAYFELIKKEKWNIQSINNKH